MADVTAATATPASAAPRTAGLRRVETTAWLTALGVGSFVLHQSRARPTAGPVLVADELGYLGTARWLARAGNSIDMVGNPFYSPGYAVVAAIPARLFSEDPAATYRWTVALNGVLTAAGLVITAVLVAWLLRASIRVTAFSGALAALLPSVNFYASVALAEALLVFLVPVSVGLVALVTTRMGESPLTRGAVSMLCGAVLGWLPATHNRMLGVAAVTAVIVSTHLVAIRSWRRLAAFTLGALASVVLWRVTNDLTERALWDSRPATPQDGMVTAVTTRHGLWQTVQVLAGQAWSFAIGTVGLGALATIALVRIACHSDGREASRLAAFTSPRRLVSITIPLGVGAALATSATFMAGAYLAGGGRPDMIVYGRYVDIFAPLLITVGAAVTIITVCRLPGEAFGPWDAFATLGAIGVSGWFVHSISATEFSTGWFSPFSSMNIANYATDVAGGTRATIGILVVTAVVGAAGWLMIRKRPHLIALRAIASIVVLLPTASLLESRWDASQWIVTLLRTESQYRREFGQQVTALAPSEVWYASDIDIFDRIVVDFWTPTISTERSPGGSVCPPDADAEALLAYSDPTARPGEVVRSGALAAAPCH